MKNSPSHVVPLLVTLALFATSYAVQFEAANNAQGTSGGDIFDQDIGIDYSKQIMATASDFIWTTFEQAPNDRKSIDLVTLTIVPKLQPDGVVAATSNNEIQYSAEYITDSGHVKTDFDGVIYHEMTRVWQWNGQNSAPSWVTEGITDFVRLKANYVPSNWPKPGEGNSWTDSYAVTAYFLDYCNGLMSGFVAQLNAKMKDGYSDDFFMQLVGRTINQLWSDYKAKYVSAPRRAPDTT